MARKIYKSQANFFASELQRYLTRWREKAFNNMVDDEREAWDALILCLNAFLLLIKKTATENDA